MAVVQRVITKRAGAPVAAECYIDNSPPPPPREEAVVVAARDRGTGRPTKPEVAGGGVGEEQGGAGKLGGLGGLGPASGRDLGVQEAPDLGSSSMPTFSGVRNGPGASALTVIPVPASSTARLRVSWTTGPLLAACPDRVAAPARPRSRGMLSGPVGLTRELMPNREH